MSRYNLIDEGWIPVRYADGQRKEIGIKQLLLEAGGIEAIEDGSPLVVAALHRFLLAVLYRALEGPVNPEQARDWFRNGWPQDKIAAYLERWRERFWLFGGDYPFGQNSLLPAARESGASTLVLWQKLASERNPNGEKMLFDHTDSVSTCSLQPADCARRIVATMNFSVSGGRGYRCSPSSAAVMCIPLGRNLFDTLSFCLVPYASSAVQASDQPHWERQNRHNGVAGRAATGYADYYTWCSRQILLQPEEDGTLRFLRFTEGEAYDYEQQAADPMCAYEISKERGLQAMPPRERGLWRDYASLLPCEEGRKDVIPPQTVNHAVWLTKREYARSPKTLLIAGHVFTNATTEFWRLEQYELPAALTEDRFVRGDITRYLMQAEATQKALYNACRSYARHLISRGKREVRGGDLDAFVRQLSAVPFYWSALQAAFHNLLHELVPGYDADLIYRNWLCVVRNTLRQAWMELEKTVQTGNAWAVRAVTIAGAAVNKELKALQAQIGEDPRKEQA